MRGDSLDYTQIHSEAQRVRSTFGEEAAVFSIRSLLKSFDLEPGVEEHVARETLAGRRESLETVLKASERPMRILSKGANHLVYGIASAAIVDREGDLITGNALRGALNQFLLRGTISLNHLDIVVGKLLSSAEVDGVLYKTEVRPITTDDIRRFPILQKHGVTPGTDAMFAVAQIYDDTKYAKQTWDDILKGRMSCFSISGQAVQENTKVECKDFTCKLVNEVDRMDGSAITICQQGMNQGAVFSVIAKKDGATMCNCNKTVDTSTATNATATFKVDATSGSASNVTTPSFTFPPTTGTYTIKYTDSTCGCGGCGCGKVQKADDKKDEKKDAPKEDKGEDKKPEGAEEKPAPPKDDKPAPPKGDAPAGDVPVISPPPKPNDPVPAPGPMGPDGPAGAPVPPASPVADPVMDAALAPPVGVPGPMDPMAAPMGGAAEKLLNILEALLGKARETRLQSAEESIDLVLKGLGPGTAPRDGKEMDLRLGYPQYPQGPTVKVTPSADAAVKAPKSPDKNMNDSRVNPEYPAGSDRMKDSANGDKIEGKRPDGFFMRSAQVLDGIIQKNPLLAVAAPALLEGAAFGAGANMMDQKLQAPGGPKDPNAQPAAPEAPRPDLPQKPAKIPVPQMPKPGAMEHMAGAVEPSTETGQNLQGAVMGGLGGARRDSHRADVQAVGQQNADNMAAYRTERDAVLGQRMGKEYVSPHTPKFSDALVKLEKAGYGALEAHKIAAAATGYEYVRKCTSCFALMKAHKNYQFYALMLNKAVTTGAVPVRSLEHREEAKFQKDVKLVRDALSKLNFSTAPDGGMSHPMGVGLVAKDGGWVPFVGSRGGVAARSPDGRVLYGEDAQRALSGQQVDMVNSIPGDHPDAQPMPPEMADQVAQVQQQAQQPAAPPVPGEIGQFENGSPVTEPQPGGIPDNTAQPQPQPPEQPMGSPEGAVQEPDGPNPDQIYEQGRDERAMPQEGLY